MHEIVHLLALMVALILLFHVSQPSFWAINIMKVITNLTSKEHMSFDVAIVADESMDSSNFKMSRIKRLSTEQLFSNAKEVMIEHLNETYILRITKQNKLILTK